MIATPEQAAAGIVKASKMYRHLSHEQILALSTHNLRLYRLKLQKVNSIIFWQGLGVTLTDKEAIEATKWVIRRLRWAKKELSQRRKKTRAVLGKLNMEDGLSYYHVRTDIPTKPMRKSKDR